MRSLNRREFLQLGASFATLLGLGLSAAPRLAQAAQELALGPNPVLWLQGLSCSGCSVSLLNSQDPGPDELITRYISLLFHSTLSVATGETAMEVVHGAIKRGGFYLACEGSLPEGMESACVMGEIPMTKLVAEAAKKAKALITVGTCSSFGGVPAAEGNPTGAVAVPKYLQNQGINLPTIRLPGCPCHPDWVVGTLIHTLAYGLPPLDAKGRPLTFYGKSIHSQCPRFADYERKQFAKTFGEDGCLFQLGCLGPRTFADCPVRLWNNGTNFCINAGAPCIGCASHEFVAQKDFALYPKGQEIRFARAGRWTSV